MPASTATLKASAVYKKAGGTVELTQAHLQWTPDGKHTPTLKLPLTEADALLCSKAGTAQVKLKLVLKKDEQGGGHNFTFTSPPTTALQERDKFKNELTNIIARNRASESSPSKAIPSASSVAGAASRSNVASSSKRPVPSAASTPRPTSSMSQSRAPSRSRTPNAGSAMTPEDFRLCKKVLLKNAELAELHRDLVMSGQISELEFWEGRQQLLQAEAAVESQRQGRPGMLVDPRPETLPSGEIKIVITPQLVHDIFDEFPVVAQAYAENVPTNLSEALFWQRYFQSKLFYTHQASIRSSATQHVVKADSIFDKYLRKTDDGLQPINQRGDVVEKLIDLEATQEDHGETGNQKDVSMQAGKQRGALPLIRRFNEHSERLLNSALGDAPAAKRRRVDKSRDGDDRYAEFIDLEDLHDSSQVDGVLLNIQQSQRFFESGSKNTVVNGQKVDAVEARRSMEDNLTAWTTNLSSLGLDKKAADRAMISMTDSVRTRVMAKASQRDIPGHVLRQMATCQTAANEFLRQFWHSVFPPFQDVQHSTSPVSSFPAAAPAQRMAKAAKMAGYLSTTDEKVNALIRTAKESGVESSVIENAMRPLLNSVKRALEFHESRQH